MTVATQLEIKVIGNATHKFDISNELTILEGTTEPEKGKGIGCFRVLCGGDDGGDKRITWMSMVLEQIREAKKLFNELVREGLVPYRVGLDGKQTSEVMTEFDPSAEEVIFLPVRAVAGG